MIFPWNRPREISIGAGNVIVGHGHREGRPFIMIRPAKTPGEVGATPDGYNPGLNEVRATREDTIIWIDGDFTPFVNSLIKAHAASVGYGCAQKKDGE